MNRAEPSGSHVALGRGTEFDLVRELIDIWGTAARGIGDDAAELVVPPGETLVVSTDTSAEDVHFRAAWITAEEIGYRVVVAALSDLAAMAARPLGIIVALTLSPPWLPKIRHIAEGIGSAARTYGAPIVGGDLVAGPTLSCTITVLGCVTQPLRRSGAQPGDTVFVTGTLGGPSLAIAAWERGETPRAADRARFAHPEVRLREAEWLRGHGATAAIDCSDGLASDLGHLAAASDCALSIDLDRVPRVDGASAHIAATSGEEFELIVSAPASLDVAGFTRSFRVPLTAIGAVHRADDLRGAPSAGSRVHWTSAGMPVPPLRGFAHFSG